MASSPKAPEALASRPAPDWPVLHAIVDADVCERAGWDPVSYARALLAGGATFLQVRAKLLASGPFLDICDAVVELCEARGATVIINDRADLALMSRARGVHVGQDDLSVAAVRTLLGEPAIVGYSTHTLDQVEKARLLPVSYIAVGPVFGTMTKATGYEAVGVEMVAAAARCAADRPIVAIGGITLDRAPAVLAAGARSVAVIGDLLITGDPERRTAEYVAALG